MDSLTKRSQFNTEKGKTSYSTELDYFVEVLEPEAQDGLWLDDLEDILRDGGEMIYYRVKADKFGTEISRCYPEETRIRLLHGNRLANSTSENKQQFVLPIFSTSLLLAQITEQDQDFVQATVERDAVQLANFLDSPVAFQIFLEVTN